MFILVDAQNIVRCVATEVNNLWIREGEAIHSKNVDNDNYEKRLVELGYKCLEGNLEGRIGDEYTDGVWISHPENYPQPSEDELRMQVIAVKKELDVLESIEADLGIVMPEKAILQSQYTAIGAKLRR